MEDENRATAPAAGSPMSDEELLEHYSKTFVGAYSHTLDTKGRLIVPAAFREGLGERFCIGPSYNFKSIGLYPTLVWARTRESYARLGGLDSRVRRYLEQFDMYSYRDQEIDNQGRILLPGRIRQRVLKDAKDVEIAGASDYVRVVAQETADLEDSAFEEDLPDILDAIDRLSRDLMTR